VPCSTDHRRRALGDRRLSIDEQRRRSHRPATRDSPRWAIVDPNEISAIPAIEPSGRRALRLERNRAIDPAAADIRGAKMLLFAPQALLREQATAPRRARTRPGRKTLRATIIPTNLTETLKVMALDAPGGPFGYLRIYGFDTDPDRFLDELLRLIPELPDHGLIIDIRANPGGYIWAAEMALQLFTPNRFSRRGFHCWRLDSHARWWGFRASPRARAVEGFARSGGAQW
jgi:hypothetical protein